MDIASLQATEGFNHQVGANCGQVWREGFGGVVGRDWQLTLKEDVAGVESGVDAHGGHAGDGFALRNRPLDGGCAAIFGKKRAVQVDITEGWKVEHPLRNEAAVADDDDGFGLECGELGAEFVVVLDLVGLYYWQRESNRGLLDG